MTAEEKLLSDYNKDFRESNRALKEKVIAQDKIIQRLKKKIAKLTKQL